MHDQHKKISNHIIALFALLFATSVWAQESYVIKSDYLELHTGPSESFPVFYVIEAGEIATVLKEQGHWFQLETESGTKGWASVEQLFIAVGSDAPTRTSLKLGRKIVSAGYGWLDGGGDFSVGAGYRARKNLDVMMDIKRIIDSATTSDAIQARIDYALLDRLFAPTIFAGVGMLKNRPDSMLAGGDPKSTAYYLAGASLRYRFSNGLNFVLAGAANSIPTANESRLLWNYRFEIETIF